MPFFIKINSIKIIFKIILTLLIFLIYKVIIYYVYKIILYDYVKMKIKFVPIVFLLYISIIYADINTLFNIGMDDVVINTNNKHQLYFEQSFAGGYNFIKFNAETKLYYRTSIYNDDRTNKIFQNTKLDLGIENNFSLSSDMVGLFADIRPLSFFGIRVNAYFNYIYNIMNFGYAGFDNNNVDYSYGSLLGMSKTDAMGVVAGLTPYFLYKLPYVIFINSTSFNYVFAGDKNYYYDSRTAILHKKSEFEIMNDFFILANISPFYIGASYALTYLVNSNILTHKLAIVGFISFKFLQNRLSLDILASSGLHVKLPYYNSSTFIEAKASLVYKIL